MVLGLVKRGELVSGFFLLLPTRTWINTPGVNTVENRAANSICVSICLKLTKATIFCAG